MNKRLGIQIGVTAVIGIGVALTAKAFGKSTWAAAIASGAIAASISVLSRIEKHALESENS